MAHDGARRPAPAQAAGRPRAFVVHWEPGELPAKVGALEAAGAQVVGSESIDGQRAYAEVRRLQPDLLVVWLAWKPSHGRVTAAAIRSAAWGRRLPILFVDGDPEPTPAATLQRIKAAVPDALVDTPARLAFWVGRVAASRLAAQGPG